jgi:hypothetical protein
MPKTTKADTADAADAMTPASTSTTGTLHVGANLGHGFVKFTVIKDGNVFRQTVFPSQIAPVNPMMAGGLIDPPPSVTLGEHEYWYGESAARHSKSALNNLTRERLEHPVLLPVLALAALNEMGLSHLNGSTDMFLVTGLPATQVNNPNAAALVERLRSVMPWLAANSGRILVTAEPLGALFAQLLNNEGEVVGDEALNQGRVAMLDLGLGTCDAGIVEGMQALGPNFTTWDELGVGKALHLLRSKWSSQLEMPLSMLQVDQAIRNGGMNFDGGWWSIPNDWTSEFVRLGEEVIARLREVWGAGKDINVMIAAGGGAAIPPLIETIQQAYPRLRVAEDPQYEISLGYARRAVNQAKERR